MAFLSERLILRWSLLAVCLAVWMAPVLGAYVVETVHSPDGLKVAVVTDLRRGDVGEYEITVTDYSPQAPDWGESRVLGTAGYNWHPRWSPDGSKLTFTSRRLNETNQDVFVINADGTGEVNLTSGRLGSDGWSSWSPNGSKIAFFSKPDPTSPTWLHELWIMNSDGSSLVRVGGFFEPWSTLVTWLDSETLGLWQDYTDYIAKVDGSLDPRPTGPPSSPGAWPPPSVVLATLAPRRAVLSPLALGSVFAKGLAAGGQLAPTLAEDGRISTHALGSCVQINGVFAPILAAAVNQINFQVPAETPAGPNQLTVLTDCNTALPKTAHVATFDIERASPGFFRYATGYTAARFQDGVPVAPAGAVTDELGRPSRPAKPGETISIYGTGWGPTTVSIKTGEVVREVAPLLPEANPKVSFGGVPLPSENILYIGAAPGAAGLYQLNMVVPSTPNSSGDRDIVLNVYGKSSQPGPVVPVAP